MLKIALSFECLRDKTLKDHLHWEGKVGVTLGNLLDIISNLGKNCKDIPVFILPIQHLSTIRDAMNSEK